MSLICQPTSEDMKLYIIIIIISRWQDGRKRSLPYNPLHHWSNKSQEFRGTSIIIIIIIMYIYHALINCSHDIYWLKYNILYLCRAQSYLNNLHKVLYGNTHTHAHTHNDCSRNWVLILVGAKIVWQEEGFQFGFKRLPGLSSVEGLVEVNSKCGVQSKRRYESHQSCVCIVGFPACGYQKKSVVYETECRHIAVQRGKQDQNHL